MSHRGRANADDVLATALAAGKTHAEAAAVAGVSPKTVFRRVRCPAFRAKVDAARGAAVGAAMGALCDGMTRAAGVLIDLLGSASEDTRHRAAVKVLELATRLRDQDELARRVGELERRAAGGAPEAAAARPPWERGAAG